MRIATYNLCNSTCNWHERLYAIVEEIASLEADVVAMQEAPSQVLESSSFVQFFKETTDYLEVSHLSYPEEENEGLRSEGLAILSRLPVRDVRTNWENNALTENNWAARVTLEWSGVSLSLTNVHLDWENARSRQRYIARIVSELIDSCSTDYDILCGDFNEGSQGAISQMLQQQTTMQDYNTQWTDLAVLAYSALGQSPPSTLISNIDSSEGTLDGESSDRRFDRIYLRANDKAEPRVSGAGLFGMGSNGRMIVPSDHCGVYVDIDWNEEA